MLPQTHAVGLWRLADEYINAASVLGSPNRRPTNPPSFPLYYLSCHGLELSLKAFLVSQGTSERRLRRLSHNLVRVLAAAERGNCWSRSFLSPSDRAVIEWVNSYYEKKEFEYLRTGYKSFPNPAQLLALCVRLHSALKPTIWITVRKHLRSTGT